MTHQLTLSPDLESFVAKLIDSGRFDSVNGLVAAALEAYLARESLIDRAVAATGMTKSTLAADLEKASHDSRARRHSDVGK